MINWLLNCSNTNIIENNIADKWLCYTLVIVIIIFRYTTEYNTNRTSHVPHYNVGETKIFNTCSFITNLNRTTISIIDQTIANCNILQFTTAKTEYRPACTKTAIAN